MMLQSYMLSVAFTVLRRLLFLQPLKQCLFQGHMNTVFVAAWGQHTDVQYYHLIAPMVDMVNMLAISCLFTHQAHTEQQALI